MINLDSVNYSALKMPQPCKESKRYSLQRVVTLHIKRYHLGMSLVSFMVISVLDIISLLR